MSRLNCCVHRVHRRKKPHVDQRLREREREREREKERERELLCSPCSFGYEREGESVCAYFDGGGGGSQVDNVVLGNKILTLYFAFYTQTHKRART